MLKLNLKIALRNLWKNKGFSLINIGGLAVGLTCCLILMLYVNYQWSYNKQFQDVDRIYVTKLNILFNGKLVTTNSVPYKFATAVQQEIPGIEKVARIEMQRSDRLFSNGENKFKLKALYVDPSFTKILDYRFLEGNAQTAFNGPNSIVLTNRAAKKLFNGKEAVGKSLKWDNDKELMVTAVIDDLPENQSIQFEVLHPWSFHEQVDPDIKNASWGSIECTTLIKLKKDTELEHVNGALKNFLLSKKPDMKSYVFEAFLFPLSRYHLYDEFEGGKPVGGKIDQVQMFAGLAFCVLIIACINYMNLSTAKSERRGREVGVRKVLGSAKGSIIWQFILESVLLSFLAMFVAFALLEVSWPYFNNLLALDMRIDYSSFGFWAMILTILLITGLAAGSYPAFYLSSFIPVKVLKGFRGKGGSLPVRKILVVFQFTLSICMIISAIFVYNQIQFMRNKPLGFDQSNLVQLSLEGNLRDPSKLELFKNELKREGAIVAATEFSNDFTRNGSITGDIKWPGKLTTDKSVINYRSVGFEFTKTIGAKVVRGRDFSPKFVSDTSTSILLNEAAVKLMGLKNPIGTVLTWENNQPLTIVGVVNDFFSTGVADNVEPTFYYYNMDYSQVILLRLNPNRTISQAVGAIKSVSEKLNPAFPVEFTFISNGMEEKLENERLLSVLSNVFGGFAIFISCLGLLGLALYTAEQRNKEISIRKVLGANMKDILLLLNKDFLKLVIISNIIAIPIAYVVVSRWLQNYDFKTSINFLPFLIAIILSLLIAILTVSLQTFKVAKANPINALKYE